MMVGQGPTRRLTTLKSSSSVMRKMGEILMKRELRATRSPSQLPLRNDLWKLMARRATPLAVNHLLPKLRGQRPLGLQRQNRDHLPRNLPHLHLTGALPGIGAPLETTQIVEVLPASPPHRRMRMKHGANGENSLHLRSLWLWSGPGDDEKRRSVGCKRSGGQPVLRSSKDLMRSLGHLTNDSKPSQLPHLPPLLLLPHLQFLKNSQQLPHQHQLPHQRRSQRSQHRPLLPGPLPLQVWLQLPLWLVVVAVPVAPAVAASKPAQWNPSCSQKRVLSHQMRHLLLPHLQPQRWNPRVMGLAHPDSPPARAWATLSIRSHCPLDSSGSSRSSS